ncbi:MAG TPA: hypothetical protein PK263_02820, partial [bacterium]|nr:hypothetical protein [bacterium]
MAEVKIYTETTELKQETLYSNIYKINRPSMAVVNLARSDFSPYFRNFVPDKAYASKLIISEFLSNIVKDTKATEIYISLRSDG